MSADSLPPSRGHRVREFVCSYRTLRDDQGQAVRLSTLALSDPRIAADTLAPLLAQEAVEIFAVACLSTRHRLLAWHVLSRGTRSAHQRLVARRLRPGVSHARHDRPARGAQPPQRGSHPECGRCPTHPTARPRGRRDRHPAARPPHRRGRRALLQLPRSRRAATARSRPRTALTPRRPSRPGWSGGPRARQVSRSARPLSGLTDLTGPPGPPRLGNYVMAGSL